MFGFFRRLFIRREPEVTADQAALDLLAAKIGEQVGARLADAIAELQTAKRRHEQAAEHFRILVNAGICKVKADHDVWIHRN
jgi:hypothetical protein